MDIYRYFHPHHNPRLRMVPVRLQELGELEQAALELKRAIERAELRAKSAPLGEIQSEHFSELTSALNFVVDNLKLLTQSHPGDRVETLAELWEERRSLPGWETWARIVRERLVGSPEEGHENTLSSRKSQRLDDNNLDATKLESDTAEFASANATLRKHGALDTMTVEGSVTDVTQKEHLGRATTTRQRDS